MFDSIRAGSFKLRSIKDTPPPVPTRDDPSSASSGPEGIVDSQDLLQVLMRTILMRRESIKEDVTDDTEDDDDDDWEDDDDDDGDAE